MYGGFSRAPGSLETLRTLTCVWKVLEKEDLLREMSMLGRR